MPEVDYMSDTCEDACCSEHNPAFAVMLEFPRNPHALWDRPILVCEKSFYAFAMLMPYMEDELKGTKVERIR